MEGDATRLAVVRAWLFAVTVVSGLIACNAAIAHDGKKHTDESPHVLFGTEALLMLECADVIATNTHLFEECPGRVPAGQKPPDYEFVGIYRHLSPVIARGSRGLALHWRILP